MVITFVAAFDPACRNQTWCDIINNLTPHKAYSVVYRSNYLGGTSIVYGQTPIEPILAETDLIVACPGIDNGHFSDAVGGRMDGPAAIHDGPFLPVPGSNWASLGKPIIIWLWGSQNIRGHYSEFHRVFDRWRVWASDEDIATEGGFSPGLRPSYLPYAVRKVPQEFTVAHSSSNPLIKNTSGFQAVCKEAGIKHTVIQQTPYRECIRIKSESSVNFDHLQGYSGASSWECTEMGVPNIVNLNPKYSGALKSAWSSDTLPPWHYCQMMSDVSNELIRLRDNPSLVVDSGLKHREWYRKHFRPAELVDKFFINGVK